MVNKDISLADVATNHVLFSSIFLKVLDKNKQIVPLHLNPVQKDILKNMTPRTIILKGRQMGVSTLMQSLLYRLAITQTIAGLVLSHEDRSTQAFRRMFTRFQENMPDGYAPTFNYNNRTIISIKETDSEIVVATAGGSGNVGRGFSFSHIHFSEYAFVNDPRPMLAGALQSGNPRVVLESTANGTDNHFYELCMQAHEEPESSVWRLLFYEWWHLAEYKIELSDEQKAEFVPDEEELNLMQRFGLVPEQIMWRRQKIKELGRKLFNQEYPESVQTAFLSSGVGYFSDIPHLEDQLTAPFDAAPDDSQTYIAGLDLGRNKDYTVLSIINKNTNQEVDLMRVNQLSWNAILGRVIDRLKYWNVKTIWVENNNVGNVIFEQIFDLIEQHQDLQTQVQVINTNSKTKPQLVNQFHVALEEKKLALLPDPQGKKEIYQFTAKQTEAGNWKFSAESGHDDITMARLFAWHGILMDDIKLLDFV